MSNQESSSNNSSSSAPEQIPHSGVHGFERPVQEFDKTSLADAVDQGLVKTPDTPATLQLDLDSKKTGTFKKAGVALAGLGLATAGFFGAKAMGGDSPNTESRVEPSASAPANPGEKAPMSAQEAIGTPINDSLESVNTIPTKELISEALKPVTVEQYPDPEKALQKLRGIYNVYILSGEIDASAWTPPAFPPETPSSSEEGEKLLRNAYSSAMLDKVTTHFEDERTERRIIAMEYYYLNSIGAEKDREGKFPTWRSEWSTDSISKKDDTSYEIRGKITLHTNLDSVDFDPKIRDNITNIDDARAGLPTHLTLSNVDGQWLITDIRRS